MINLSRTLGFVFVVTHCLVSFAQAENYLSSIEALDPPKNHYATLQKLSVLKNSERAWMDAISYPPELYRNHTLLFALAKPHYLTSSQVDFVVDEVTPPSNSSDQTRAELDFLLELQKERDAEQRKRVMEIAAIGYWPDANHVKSHPRYRKNLENLFFECTEILGNVCSDEKYPKTSVLLQGIMNDMRLMEFAVKYKKLRARPYQLEPKLNPMVKIESPSFASGHTLWAYLQAFTFAELIPQKRKEFLDLAYEIGYSRELMGVHYPSDEEAARQIAHRMLWLMWHTDKFQQDFKDAQSEWK